MKVSVIVPNYNHARFLRQRIDSILDQTFKDFELIILDDASVDDSREIIEEYKTRFPAIRSFYNKHNSGTPFKQWDLGVSKALGEYIWIAESDDFAESGFLEKATALLANNNNVGLVYCNSKIIDEQKNRQYFTSDLKSKLSHKKWHSDYINNGKKEISEQLFRHNTINNTSGVLFRKSKYIEAGWADHSMKYCGDWFLYIRILLISDVAYISAPLNSLRLHAGSSLHEYYLWSTFLLEVLTVYKFISFHIKPSVRKRTVMGWFILVVIFRNICHGRLPEFNKIFKILLSRNDIRR